MTNITRELASLHLAAAHEQGGHRTWPPFVHALVGQLQMYASAVDGGIPHPLRIREQKGEVIKSFIVGIAERTSNMRLHPMTGQMVR
jgi:hypothetical protein